MIEKFDNEKKAAQFKAGLLHLNRIELEAIYKVMKYNERIRALRQAFATDGLR